MAGFPHRATILDIPLPEEKYGRSFLAALALHAAFVAFVLLAPYLLPGMQPQGIVGLSHALLR